MRLSHVKTLLGGSRDLATIYNCLDLESTQNHSQYDKLKRRYKRSSKELPSPMSLQSKAGD